MMNYRKDYDLARWATMQLFDSLKPGDSVNLVSLVRTQLTRDASAARSTARGGVRALMYSPHGQSLRSFAAAVCVSLLAACTSLSSPDAAVSDRTIAIVGAILALVAAAIGWLQYLHQRKQSRADKRTSGQAPFFPFEHYTSADLSRLKRHKLGELADIRHTSRRPPTLQLVFENRIDHKDVLLTGRQGLGKTREAIESIERCAKRLGDEITVLVPHDNCDVPFVIPADLRYRNIVVFVDDIHLLFPPAGRSLQTHSVLDRPFDVRLADAIDALKSRFAGGAIWQLYTARDEPDLRNRLRSNAPLWSGIDEYQLPYLHKDTRKAFINAAAEHCRLSLMADALDLIAERSDGTCMGIAAALKLFPPGSVVGREDVLRSDFNFPHNWTTDVYRKQIEPHRRRRAVFIALAIIRRTRIRPRRELVLELAACVAGDAWPFRKVRMARTIANDLRAWIFEFEGEIICNTAYLDLPDLGDAWLSKLQKALRRAVRNPELARVVSVDIASLPYAIRAGNVEPEDGVAILEATSGATGDSPGVLLALASAYDLAGHQGKAVSSTEQALRIDPKVAGGYVFQSILCSKVGDIEGATEAARRATEVRREDAVSWLCYGVVLSKSKKVTDAIVALKQACALAPRWAKAHYSLAIAYDRSRQFEAAAREGVLATELDPNDSDAWESLGITYEHLNRTEDSIRALKTAHALSPGSSSTIRSLSQAYSRAGQHVEAIAIARQVLLRDPTNLDAQRWLAIALGYSDDPAAKKQSIQMFRTLAEGTNEANDWVGLSRAYGRAANHTDAVVAARQALMHDPTNADAQRSLAMNLGYSDDPATKKQSIQLFRTLAEGTNEANDWLGLSRAYGRAANHTDAAVAARRALLLDSTNLDAQRSLAIALGYSDDPATKKQSIQLFRTLAEGTNEANDWVGLSIAHGKAGNPTDAVVAARQALTHDPTNVDAQRSLAMNLGYSDDPDARKEALQLLCTVAESTDSATDWLALSGAYGRARQPSEAVSVAVRILKKNLYDVDALQALSMGLGDLPRQEAEELGRRLPIELNLRSATIQEAIAGNPSDITLWRLLGWASAFDGGHQEVVSFSLSWLKTQPELHTAVLAIAEEFRQVLPAAASLVAERIVEIEPTNTKYLNLQGAIFRALGDSAKGVDCHRRAILLDEGYGASWYGLGRAYEQLGDTRNAELAYKKAAVLGHRRAAQMLQGLRGTRG